MFSCLLLSSLHFVVFSAVQCRWISSANRDSNSLLYFHDTMELKIMGLRIWTHKCQIWQRQRHPQICASSHLAIKLFWWEFLGSGEGARPKTTSLALREKAKSVQELSCSSYGVLFPNLEKEEEWNGKGIKGRGMEGMQSLFVLWDRTLAYSQAHKRTCKDTQTKK